MKKELQDMINWVSVVVDDALENNKNLQKTAEIIHEYQTTIRHMWMFDFMSDKDYWKMFHKFTELQQKIANKIS